jgi:ribose 1,5-bisphosphokinase
LRYGIPHKQLSCLARGDDALVNLSRGVLKTADQQLFKMIVLSLTAPSSVLVTRLLGRGRESAEQISARMARSGFDLPKGLQVLQVDNSGTLDQTIDTTLSALYPDSPNREIS